MSLVIAADKIPTRNGPPVWRPRAISHCDCVGSGDAVHSGLLPLRSREELELLARWAKMLIPSLEELRLRNNRRKLQILLEVSRRS